MAKPPKKEEAKNEAEEGAPAPVEGEGGEVAEGEDGEGGGKKSKKKLILFIAIPLILLMAGGAGLYFTGTLDKVLHKGKYAEGAAAAGDKIAEANKKKEKCKEAAAKAEGGEEKKGESKGDDDCNLAGAVFLEIPNMLVNLSGPDEQPRYLRLKVQLELANQADLKAVQAVMPRVVDQFQTYLRELRIKDMRGSAGIYRLQMELLSRVNAAAYPTEVKDVLFQEILIQ
jgi:flagellar FliL protein